MGSETRGLVRAGWGAAAADSGREADRGHGPDLSARAPALRVAVVGMSTGPTCGARDHARLLAEELRGEEVACSLHWLDRRERSVRGGGAEIRAWGQALGGELARERPDAILLHYSVFAFSHRGLPLFVAPLLTVLRRSGAPVVTVLHEYVYPWRHGGLRGKVWAIAQRALLIDVMRSSSAVLLTTDFRVRWLESRPWLPRRPAAFAPVFSNLPPPAGGPSAGPTMPMDPSGSPQGSTGRAAAPASLAHGSTDRAAAPASSAHGSTHLAAALESSAPETQPAIGLFGYSYEGAALSLVLDAIALLASRGVVLRLLGAPGRTSAVAGTWLREARARGIESALEFSEMLPARDLSNALAACDLLLFVDAAGPSSRKGTLAASLASGRPVLAIDGPRRWQELVWGGVASVVEPTAPALADAMRELLDDPAAREALGARGRTFATERMGVARTAEAVRKLLDGVQAGSATAPSAAPLSSQLARATR